jgi:hypothetical protein
MESSDRKLPDLLFRGDSDPRNERSLRRDWNSGWLQTNLGSGGRGSELFQAPLVSLIEKHVNGDWPKTHFLSFTSSRVIAEEFARGLSDKALAPVSSSETNWTTAILTFDTQPLTIETSATTGVFHCRYTHRAKTESSTLTEALACAHQDAPRRGKSVPMMLIDVLSALNAVGSDAREFVEARRKATYDREWLVLPLERVEGVVGYSNLLDTSCIVRREKFQLV